MEPLLMVLSPLATSLLKVHLQLHGFSVFIDVEKLEAGKFEDKLLQSVLSARNFVLVLSPNALDKCMEDPRVQRLGTQGERCHQVGAVWTLEWEGVGDGLIEAMKT